MALQEVEDALADVEQQGKSFSALNRSIKTLSQLRYEKGIANRLDLIRTEMAEIDAQRALSNTLEQRYQSTIQLIKALGGGWDPLRPNL